MSINKSKRRNDHLEYSKKMSKTKTNINIVNNGGNHF